MADSLIQHVIEMADEAKKHRMELQELLDELEEGKTQIKESALDAEQRLCNHFTSLKVCIVNSLDQRLEELQRDVKTFSRCALEPLAECEAMIYKEIEKADKILSEGKQILSGDVDSPQSATLMTDFKSRVSAIDLNSLPEVPSLQEVACIHVELPRDGTDIETQLIEAIQDYGQVIGRAPVQIVETHERAGGLLLKWAETEDHESDIAEFSVRCCLGDLRRDPSLDSFRDVYHGHSLQALAKNLTQGACYSFQVRGRAQSEDAWSPWSVPCVATTRLAPFSWKPNVKGYQLDPDCQAITNKLDSGPAELQLSMGDVFECGHSIIFKVLESAQGHRDDAIGLCLRSDITDIRKDGALFVTSSGNVFVDGQEKTTKLPPLTSGSSVSFDTEIISSTKVRVTVEIDDKILTLDWPVLKSSGSGSTSPQQNARLSMEVPHLPALYFFVKFNNKGWKMMVE